jgi:hypothetical protein
MGARNCHLREATFANIPLVNGRSFVVPRPVEEKWMQNYHEKNCQEFRGKFFFFVFFDL